jgi:membrane-associated protease RseP (regulator of RpoE activity)
MTQPRRLWTGDWERDSALRAEELAAARALRGDQSEPEPRDEQAPAPAPAGPTPAVSLASSLATMWHAIASGLAALRRRLTARLVVPIATALLLIAAVAVALTALLNSSSGSTNTPTVSPAVLEADRWLGVQLAAAPGGSAVVETVDPNGAAAAAGLEPGDVISQVNGRGVGGLAAAASAIDRMGSGQQALITVSRGSAIYTTDFPMPARPGGP